MFDTRLFGDVTEGRMFFFCRDASGLFVALLSRTSPSDAKILAVFENKSRGPAFFAFNQLL